MPDRPLVNGKGPGVVRGPVAEHTRITAPVVILPLEPSARFSLRLRSAVATEIGYAGPFRLDLSINRCNFTGDRGVARLGPDEWLLLAPGSASDVLAGQLDEALSGRFFSLVDISHRHGAIGIAGTHAREALNAGCALDLHDEAFPPGSATRTILAKAEIVLMRPGPAWFYRVECWRSFTPYVLDFLKEASREFERT